MNDVALAHGLFWCALAGASTLMAVFVKDWRLYQAVTSSAAIIEMIVAAFVFRGWL